MKIRFLHITRLVIVLLLGIALIGSATPAYAAEYVVNTLDIEVEAGSAPCTSSHCSLFEAIFMADTHPGPDRITFRLPGDPPYVILLRTSEGIWSGCPPVFDDDTEIDGTTQPGWPIYLHGMGLVMTDLDLMSDHNTVRGLGFLGAYFGLNVEGNHNFIDRVVAGDYLGGGFIAAPFANATGIFVEGENNVIRGVSVANNDYGIWVDGDNQAIEDSQIGFLSGASSRRGNLAGIRLNGVGNTIQRNTILGNYDYGIWALSSGNVILRNRIGLDSSGSHPLGNGIGIYLYNEGGNRVGGIHAYEGNIIVANDTGIVVVSPGNQIINNRIGTDYTGAAIPNGKGVVIAISAEENILGSGWTGAGNVIAYNTEAGVEVNATSQVSVVGNTIFANGGHGVGLLMEAGEPPADGMRVTISRNSMYDNGGEGIDIPVAAFNHGVEHPSGLRVIGTTVSGRACAGCTVELFEADPDPTEFGEGKTFLTSLTAASDGSFRVDVPGLRACSQITATSTDDLGNTSDFSLNANVGLCLRVPPWIAWGWLVGTGGGGSALMVVISTAIRRRRQGGPGRLIISDLAPGVLGALLGIGLGLMLLKMPVIQVVWPEQGGQPAPPQSLNGTPRWETQTVLPLTATATDTPTRQPSGTPTPTPSPRPPTGTPTSSSTLGHPSARLLLNANCRQGPDAAYEVVTSLLADQTVEIDGRDQDGGWWWIRLPNSQAHCWIGGNLVEASGNLGSLPVVAAPPLGCWVYQPNLQKDVCTVPCPPNAKSKGACSP